MSYFDTLPGVSPSNSGTCSRTTGSNLLATAGACCVRTAPDKARYFVWTRRQRSTSWGRSYFASPASRLGRDGNSYDSVMTTPENFYDRVSKGGTKPPSC